jgi:DNA-binding MarR family transcriptional regulator
MRDVRQGGFLLTKIHHLSGRIFSAVLKKYEIDNINPGQGRILFALWQDGDGIPIQEVAKRTALEKSTLTSMLDRLEEAGFIRRVPSSEDRRVVLIELTEKHKALQNLYAKVSKKMTKIFYKGLSSWEIDDLEGYLRRILDNLVNFESKLKVGGD